MCKECEIITLENLYCKGQEVKLWIKEPHGNNVKDFNHEVGEITDKDFTILQKIRGGIVGHTRKTVTKLYIVQCNKCGAIFYRSEGNLNKNVCGVCCEHPKLVYKGVNDLWTKNPTVAQFLLNSEDGYKYSANSNIKVDFVCNCCGKICNRSINTVAGHDISEYICNDCSLQKMRNARFDLTGQKFGKWTVLTFDKEKSNKLHGKDMKRRRSYWICQCECGTIKSVFQDGLISGASKSCGCIPAEMARSRTGEKNPSYNPNLTDEDRMKRRYIDGYKEWRDEVKRQANYTCDCCGQWGGDLRSHHLNSYKYFPNQRLDVTNGVCLCSNCHSKFHKHMGGNGVKCTRNDYFTWKEKISNKEA